MVEFVNTVRHLDETDAILLLPDSGIMTVTAQEEVFLQSYRRSIPMLGVSERHVKEGALLALVVDMVNVGRIIGEHATRILRNGAAGQQSAALPPRKFDLFLNLETARKMQISIPDSLVRLAKKAYQ